MVCREQKLPKNIKWLLKHYFDADYPITYDFTDAVHY